MSQQDESLVTTTRRVKGVELPFYSTRWTLDDYKLVVTAGPHSGRERALDSTFLQLGRSSVFHLPLPEDREISHLHAELQQTPDGIEVRDLQSRNGVFLGGQRVKEALFSPDSYLQIGRTILQLQPLFQKRFLEVLFHDRSYHLVGRSLPMLRVFELLERFSWEQVPVLFTGEAGTGKSVAAKALHAQSTRAALPFVAVDCATIPVGWMESRLLGVEAGAQPGITKTQRGWLENAQGGTLFLDNIDELSLGVQALLMDVLERRAVRRIGGLRDIPLDVRFLAATRQNLGLRVQQRRFREGLLRHFGQAEIEMPPLRERLEDIPMLVDFLLRKLSPEEWLVAERDVLLALQGVEWVGNVRQLLNVLEQSITGLGQLRLQLEHLRLPAPLSFNPELDSLSPAPGKWLVDSRGQQRTLVEALEEVESQALQEALEAARWNLPQAARRLGVQQSWLQQRMQRFRLRPSSKS